MPSCTYLLSVWMIIFDENNFIAIKTEYNDYGQIKNQTDPNNNQTTYTYDEFNLFPKTIA